MRKILEAGCLFALLASASPALAQNEATPGPDTPEPIDDVVEETTDALGDEQKGERFPINGSLSLGYSFSHSAFSEAGSDSPVTTAGQFLGLDLGLSYQLLEPLSLTAGIGVLKTVDNGFLSGASGSSLSNYETNLTDLNLGARWSFFTVPVADIKLSLAGGLRLPTSKGSITRGLIVGSRLSLGASREFGPVGLSVRGGYTHNVWDDPTQQIELRFGDLIRISGADLGSPLPLAGWSLGTTLSYSVIDGLDISVTYQLSNSTSSYSGPDDEFTSTTPGVQTGTQYGTGAHSFTASLGYTLPFDTGTSLGIQMSTAQGLYSGDNKRVTNPFFDTESQQGVYTGYSVSLSQAL